MDFKIEKDFECYIANEHKKFKKGDIVKDASCEAQRLFLIHEVGSPVVKESDSKNKTKPDAEAEAKAKAKAESKAKAKADAKKKKS